MDKNNIAQWNNRFHYDPIKGLINLDSKAISFFTQRDLLNKNVDNILSVWNLPEVQQLLKNQQPDGSWKYPGNKPHSYPIHHYPLVETWKRFRILINHYEMNKTHPAIDKAAEFLFSCQTKQGDIRGMIGNQYATYYTGAIMASLIKAGYQYDSRIEKGFQWLLSIRQNDGGWTIPILTHSFDRKTGYTLTSRPMDPIEPDKSKPFSHNWTDMVLRAFAAHPTYRNSKEAKAAAFLLKSRFFKKDVYNSYKSEYYWIRFAFWWSNILTSLESLVLMGFSKNDEDIQKGLNWFIDNQQEDGLWNLSYWPGKKQVDSPKIQKQKGWISLRICKMFKNFF
jgi:squalene-hopene cyclase-like protein/prenyltransferase/squalene oxidase-like repeat protein